jgi:hypothetical protein
MTKIMAISPMEPNPHIKVKPGRAKRPNAHVYDFPHPGSLCTVLSKLFGEDHRGEPQFYAI